MPVVHECNEVLLPLLAQDGENFLGLGIQHLPLLRNLVSQGLQLCSVDRQTSTRAGVAHEATQQLLPSLPEASGKADLRKCDLSWGLASFCARQQCETTVHQACSSSTVYGRCFSLLGHFCISSGVHIVD